MSQGIRLNGFLLAFVFSTFTLGGMGWYAWVGVGFQTGLMPDARTAVSSVGNPTAQAAGTQNIGFFGIAIGVGQTLMKLATLNVELYGILVSLTAPAPIALSVQLMYNFTFGMTVLAVLRGFKII